MCRFVVVVVGSVGLLKHREHDNEKTSKGKRVVLEKRGLPCGSSTCSTSTRVDTYPTSRRGKEGKRERGWCSRKEDFHFHVLKDTGTRDTPPGTVVEITRKFNYFLYVLINLFHRQGHLTFCAVCGVCVLYCDKR